MNQTKEVPVFGDPKWIARRNLEAREAWIKTLTPPKCPEHPAESCRVVDELWFGSGVVGSAPVAFACNAVRGECEPCDGSGVDEDGDECGWCDGSGEEACQWFEVVQQ